VLALRGSAALAGGPGADRFQYDVGGAEGASETLTGFTFGAFSEQYPVRGYPSGARSGSRAWSATAEHRFPIARVDRGIGLVPIYLEQVHGDLFVDAGNAWGPRGNARRRALASVGAELSFDLTAFFATRVPLRLGAALPLVEANARGRDPLLYLRLGPAF
jgi:hemolysin activation/secretion protein